MKTKKVLSLATAAALTLASASAFATHTIGAGTNSGAAGATVTIPVTYVRPAGDGFNVFSATFRFAHNNPPITFVSFTSVGGTLPASSSVACGANPANTLTTCVLTTNPPTAIAVGNYSLGTITYQIGAGAAAGNQPLTTTVVECTDTVGDPIVGACTPSNGQITVTGGGANTPPAVSYAPNFGSTITYAGAGTAAPIVVTPSGGAGSGAAATTTVGACTIAGGGAAFPTTNIGQLSFVGATVTPQNLVLPNCVPQAVATNATLTCPETLGAGAATNRVWTLTCPAAAAANVPPAITYNPVAGSSIGIASNGNSTIQVGCPTDGVNCTGSGSGLDATSRLEQLSVVYAGPPFSPTPNDLTCAFVTEAGAAAGATLDFAATAADVGDIRCACTQVFTAEPYTVTVRERIPASAGAITATRTFNVTCGQGLTCGSITAANQSPGATINLNNGGAAVQVTQVTVAGLSAGVTQNVTCTVAGAPAGSTFTLTTVPSPLILNSVTTTGTVSATCTNSNAATATATATCTSVGSAPGCAALNASFSLACPGQAAPPPTPSVPVPALNEQGRILLAALVLLLGLGVVGFRLRG